MPLHECIGAHRRIHPVLCTGPRFTAKEALQGGGSVCMLIAGFHQGSATRPAPRAGTSSACARKSPGRQRPGPDLRPRLGTGASAHAAPPAPASPPSAAAGVLLPLADVPSGGPVPSEGSSGEPARGRRRGAGVLSEPSPPPLSGDCACSHGAAAPCPGFVVAPNGHAPGTRASLAAPAAPAPLLFARASAAMWNAAERVLAVERMPSGHAKCTSYIRAEHWQRSPRTPPSADT